MTVKKKLCYWFEIGGDQRLLLISSSGPGNPEENKFFLYQGNLKCQEFADPNYYS